MSYMCMYCLWLAHRSSFQPEYQCKLWWNPINAGHKNSIFLKRLKDVEDKRHEKVSKIYLGDWAIESEIFLSSSECSMHRATVSHQLAPGYGATSNWHLAGSILVKAFAVLYEQSVHSASETRPHLPTCLLIEIETVQFKIAQKERVAPRDNRANNKKMSKRLEISNPPVALWTSLTLATSDSGLEYLATGDAIMRGWARQEWLATGFGFLQASVRLELLAATKLAFRWPTALALRRHFRIAGPACGMMYVRGVLLSTPNEVSMSIGAASLGSL